MSATRDKTQKVAFLNTNLYKVYRKETEAAKSASTVLRSSGGKPEVTVQNYVPVNFLNPAEPKKPYLDLRAIPSVPNPALEGLQKSLNQLNDLHQRLKVMLQELEDLCKE